MKVLSLVITIILIVGFSAFIVYEVIRLFMDIRDKRKSKNKTNTKDNDSSSNDN